MTEFLTGLILGGLLVFCICEYNRLKSRIICAAEEQEKGEEHSQWNNIMNYDGTGRRQYIGED